MLKTPEKIRELQRKLYQKAKQEKEYRFYLLYDKVYRLDILARAYNLVKANKGLTIYSGRSLVCLDKIIGVGQDVQPVDLVVEKIESVLLLLLGLLV